MDGYTQQIYHYLKGRKPHMSDEILARAAKNIAERHRAEGYATSHTGWTEAPILWAETKEPVRKQRESFTWANHQWSAERMADEYIKAYSSTYDEDDKEHLIEIFEEKRWEHKPPIFRYRMIKQ